MMTVLLKWLASTVAVLVTGSILPGVVVKDFTAAVLAALALGLINAFVRPVVLLFTLPFNILTLGCLTFVINALFIMLVAELVPGFEVKSFWWALLFSLVLSLVNGLLNRVRPQAGPRPTPDVVP
jgi:putative membrane protein